MKFTLNIYEKRKVVKTYEAESYDLMFGTMEDFLSIIDERMFADNVSDLDFAKLGLALIKNSLGQLKPLLFDVFDGLTDEELRNAKTPEVVGVIVAIAKYSIKEIKGISNEKNV